MSNGPLRKMRARSIDAVSYTMLLGEVEVPMDRFIGQTFSLHFDGHISCIRCGRNIKKTYGQGFCFPCFRDAPENSECIVRPELCRAHLGEGRDVEWEREHHAQEHVVYLSYTSSVKVGVTRSQQVPARWIDQGATMATIIARTPYRQLAGAIEVSLKRIFADRTNWRNMLKGRGSDAEVLLKARKEAENVLDPSLIGYLVDPEVQHIHYPLEKPPPQVKSVSLDKVPDIRATLAGIKGQYLVWADGRVLNVRNHSGYHVDLGT